MNESAHADSAILRQFCRFRAARTYQTPTLTAIFPGVPLHGETPAWERGGKRVLDVARSVVVRALFGLAWPLTALAIRLESRGSVLHSRVRVGIDCRPRGQQHDKRVARVGGFPQLFRADEAPHFHIVSNDDMSVIGSRTERPPFSTRAMRVAVTGEGAR